MPIKSSFLLSKWYLDCVDEQGRAIIGYVGELKWTAFRLFYTSILTYNGDGVPNFRSRLRQVHWPEMADGTLTWADEPWGLKGEWIADAPAIQQRIYEDEAGSLEWQCYQPRSKVRFSMDGGKDVIYGFGYAEKLSMTIEPWRVPMDQLRWGRYCSEEDNIVWIDLRAETNRRWVFYNGVLIVNTAVTDDYIEMPDLGLRLTLDRSGSLESEKKILKTVHSFLDLLPGFGNSTPLRFLQSDEFKWRSKGILFQHGALRSEGWAIHELVDFALST